VVAERASRLPGWNCLVIEKQHHHPGNGFDRMHPSGVPIQLYCARSNQTGIADYLLRCRMDEHGITSSNEVLRANRFLFPEPDALTRSYKPFCPAVSKGFSDFNLWHITKNLSGVRTDPLSNDHDRLIRVLQLLYSIVGH